MSIYPTVPLPLSPNSPRALPLLLIMLSLSIHPVLRSNLGFTRLPRRNEKADYDECPFARRRISRLPMMRLLLGSNAFLRSRDRDALAVESVTARSELRKLVSRTYRHCHYRTAIQQKKNTTRLLSLVTMMLRAINAMNI